MARYHYEWAAYTDNLCWGRMLLARGSDRDRVTRTAEAAGKGCFIIVKERVYDK